MEIIHQKFRALIGPILTVFLTFYLASPAAAKEFVLIANKSLETNSLSKADLQSIFLGEKVKWDNRHYIKIVLFEEPKILREFLLDIVDRTSAQYENHWRKLVFTGKANMPQTFTDKASLIEFVAGKPGAIGFIPAGKAGDSVKVISIK